MNNIEKHPQTCGYSIDVGGIYVCKLSVIPCIRVPECPLGCSNKFIDAIINFVDNTSKMKDNTSK